MSVAVFPANLHMAINEVYLPVEGLPQSPAALWGRLPFQLVFAALVWFVGLYEPEADATD